MNKTQSTYHKVYYINPKVDDTLFLFNKSTY